MRGAGSENRPCAKRSASKYHLHDIQGDQILVSARGWLQAFDLYWMALAAVAEYATARESSKAVVFLKLAHDAPVSTNDELAQISDAQVEDEISC